MPKPIKIRVHYTEDAKYLLRLKQAVQKDSRPAKWTDEICGMLDELSVKLIQAPPKESRSTVAKPKHRVTGVRSKRRVAK